MKTTKGLVSRVGLTSKSSLSSRTQLSSKSGFKTSSTKIKSTSKKQISVEEDLKGVYELIKSTRDFWCTGCGSTQNLDHSHLIPRSRRSDLVTEIKNITYHCRACHLIWEHGSQEEKKKLHDFSRNMEYIKEVDVVYYNILKSKK